MTLPLPLSAPTPQGVEQTAPTEDRGAIRFGLLVLLLGLGALLGWSVLAPLSSGVVAPARLVVDSHRKAIQNLEGGIIAELPVRDGDRVVAGQVLVRLDDVAARAARNTLSGQYLAALAQEARLLAERDGAGGITFPDRLSPAGSDPRLAEIRATQERVFAARAETLAGELSILDQRLRQLDQQRVGLLAQAAAAEEQLALLGQEIEGLAELHEKGFASRTRLLDLQRRRSDLTGQAGRLAAELARTDVAAGEARLQALQARSTFREQVAADLQEVRRRLLELEDRLRAADDTLERRLVRAPIDGIVVGSRVHTVGGVVAPGEMMMELVPLDDRLVVEAMVTPRDIDVVQLGMPAEVRLSALSVRNLPIVRGHLVHLSADIRGDAPGTEHYLARVEVPEAEIRRLGDVRLVPGMPMDVLLKSGERTLLDYLLRPLTDSLFHAFKEE